MGLEAGADANSAPLVSQGRQEDKEQVNAEHTELWRVGWGRGRKTGANVIVEQKSVILPPSQIMGERLERAWPGTCSGDQLLSFLKKWDGREYDVNPGNGRNCHHFVQDMLQTCTDNYTGYVDPPA